LAGFCCPIAGSKLIPHNTANTINLRIISISSNQREIPIAQNSLPAGNVKVISPFPRRIV
jgi:hypothetical protein